MRKAVELVLNHMEAVQTTVAVFSDPDNPPDPAKLLAILNDLLDDKDLLVAIAELRSSEKNFLTIVGNQNGPSVVLSSPAT